jgi:glycosyltransferase involved in cell wall biosynthesis
MPKINQMVSVIIPTYNRAPILAQTLRSVYLQTYRNIEIIVIDDGSSDNTSDVVSKFPNIKYLYQENKKIAAARNAGMKIAKGEYIAFLDSDDLWAPAHLESSVNIFDKMPEVGLVGGAHAYFTNNGKIIKAVVQSTAPKGDILKEMFLKNTPFQTSTSLIRRDLLNKVGLFDADIGCFKNGKVGEDYEYFCRIASHTKMAYIKEILVFYRSHDDNITDKSALYVIYSGKRYIAERFPELSPFLNQAEAEALSRAGFLSIKNGNSFKALRYFINSILKSPLHNPMGWVYPYKGILKCLLSTSQYEYLKSIRTQSLDIYGIDDMKWKDLWEKVSLPIRIEKQ